MHRIDSINAVDGKFVAGNPATGKRPTAYTADHANAIQEELANVVEAAGITLDKGDNAQLLAAINALVVSKIHGICSIRAANPYVITDCATGGSASPTADTFDSIVPYPLPLEG